MKKSWIFLWVILLGTLILFSLSSPAASLPDPAAIGATIIPRLLGGVDDCPECDHAVHLPQPCREEGCFCGACPICGDAIHLPEACRTEGCTCGTGVCPWCGDADHLPNACQIQGCRCGALLVETCPDCGHIAHLPAICQILDCNCGKCPKCHHAVHLPKACGTAGCTCVLLAEDCQQCGHSAHLPDPCPENGCTCGKAETPAATGGTEPARSQPWVISSRRPTRVAEASAPPDIKVVEHKKNVARHWQQMLKIFAGGLLILLLVAGGLVCWRML